LSTLLSPTITARPRSSASDEAQVLVGELLGHVDEHHDHVAALHRADGLHHAGHLHGADTERLRRMPAVSTKTYCLSPLVTSVSMASRVVPGTSVTTQPLGADELVDERALARVGPAHHGDAGDLSSSTTSSAWSGGRQLLDGGFELDQPAAVQRAHGDHLVGAGAVELVASTRALALSALLAT
jgi:hypothetical protein